MAERDVSDLVATLEKFQCNSCDARFFWYPHRLPKNCPQCGRAASWNQLVSMTTSELPPQKAKETVHHPLHYGGDVIYETIKVLEAQLTAEQFIGFCRGNAIKYLSRAGKKGDPGEDIAKSMWYARCEADFLERLKSGMVGERRAIEIALKSWEGR